MEKEKKETIETREYQSEFMKKILAGAPISNTEWFQYVANAKDCNPFTKNMGFDKTLKVFMRICQALADFGPEWRAKGWPAVIDAVEKHTLLKGRDIVDELMKNLDKNEEKIDAMQRELNKLHYETIPDLKRNLLLRDIENVYGGPCDAANALSEKLKGEGLTKEEEEEIEKACIKFSMERHNEKLRDAAKELGMTQWKLKRKLIKYGL